MLLVVCWFGSVVVVGWVAVNQDGQRVAASYSGLGGSRTLPSVLEQTALQALRSQHRASGKGPLACNLVWATYGSIQSHRLASLRAIELPYGVMRSSVCVVSWMLFLSPPRSEAKDASDNCEPPEEKRLWRTAVTGTGARGEPR